MLEKKRFTFFLALTALILILGFLGFLISSGSLALDTKEKSAGAEGKPCGGIAANLLERRCPAGYYCKLTEKGPDASGLCVRKILPF